MQRKTRVVTVGNRCWSVRGQLFWTGPFDVELEGQINGKGSKWCRTVSQICSEIGQQLLEMRYAATVWSTQVGAPPWTDMEP